MALKAGERALRYLEEQDHGDPLRRGADAATGEKPEKHLAWGHDQRNEEHADHRADGKALVEFVRRLKQGAVFFDLLPLAFLFGFSPPLFVFAHLPLGSGNDSSASGLANNASATWR